MSRRLIALLLSFTLAFTLASVSMGGPAVRDQTIASQDVSTVHLTSLDADPDLHTAQPGGTAPLDVEVQQTAYAFDTQGAFGNVAIVEFKIINKLGSEIDSTYVALWSDPDIGYALNDLTGCDTTLDVGLAYNGSSFDDVYGESSPCVGFDFLDGPRDKTGEPLGMTSFVKYSYNFDPTGPLESYNLMKGLSHTGTTHSGSHNRRHDILPGIRRSSGGYGLA